MGRMSALTILLAFAFVAPAAFLLSSDAYDRVTTRRRREAVRSRAVRGARVAGVASIGESIASLLAHLPALHRLFEDVTHIEERRRKAIREQLPQALRSLSASLSVGQSNLQAFSYVADNTADPLGGMLKQVVWDMEAGGTLADALRRLSVRTDLPEMELVCVAFSLQQRSGGSMREILDTAAGSVRASFEFDRSMKVQTAQARLSARIVGLVPVLLMVVLALISPSYLASFMSSAAGPAILILAVMLDLVGLFLIRRIISVGR